MANIKVIDINEADKQEETTAIEDTKAIEEAKPEEEMVNEVVEEIQEEVQEEEQPKPKAKPKPSDRVDCNTCGKNLSYKNYRYRHEKLCTAEPKPVKAQAKPKAKVKMMSQPNFKQVEVYEVEKPKPVKKEIPPMLLTKLLGRRVSVPRINSWNSNCCSFHLEIFVE